MLVEAGATLQAVQEAAEREGLMFAQPSRANCQASAASSSATWGMATCISWSPEIELTQKPKLRTT
ncbi:MAG: hypothetical protein EPO25_16020 [Gammaproteobacteria bacterium]|nr:MAG: hypothetical protein EPO25_16020 [Gammaproteobacteria bacterium]